MNYFSKSFRIALFLLLSGYSAYSQSNELYIYGELGGGDGTHGIFKAAMSAIFCKQNVISLSFYYASHRAPNIPSDYNLNTIFGSFWPQQTVSMFGISYGLAFFSNNPHIRFIAKGGITEGLVQTAANFISPSIGAYTYSIESNMTTGVVLDPAIEFLLSKGFGFSVGLYANINAINSVFGIDASMIFRKVRGKSRKHSTH